MQIPLILLFSVDCFERDELEKLTSQELFDKAVANVDNGSCDIYTLDDFCEDVNNEWTDVLTSWWMFNHYVDEEIHNQWYK